MSNEAFAVFEPRIFKAIASMDTLLKLADGVYKFLGFAKF